MAANKHGLSRDIPTHVARTVRQRCKFGCVMCREAIYQYEHIDPPFAEAHEHDPAKICLLCGRCHDKVTRGYLSKETIFTKYASVETDPNIKPPYSEFDFQGNNFEIALGKCVFEQPKALISIGNEVLIGFSEPEYPNGPPRLSGVFRDERGMPILTVRDNVWSGDLGSWDIQTRGGKIEVWTAKGQQALGIKLVPPRALEVYHLNMGVGPAIVRNRNEYLEIVREAASGRITFGMYGRCVGATACVHIDDSIASPTYQGITMVGGGGTSVLGAGITWGKGTGLQWIMRLAVNGQVLL